MCGLSTDKSVDHEQSVRKKTGLVAAFFVAAIIASFYFALFLFVL